MNWRRGMLRLWVVASLVWFGVVGWHWYTEVYEPHAVATHEQPCVEYLRAHPKLGNPNGCHDERYPYIDEIGYRVGTGVFIVLALATPLASLGAGFGVGWVIAGFRRRHPNRPVC